MITTTFFENPLEGSDKQISFTRKSQWIVMVGEVEISSHNESKEAYEKAVNHLNLNQNDIVQIIPSLIEVSYK